MPNRLPLFLSKPGCVVLVVVLGMVFSTLGLAEECGLGRRSGGGGPSSPSHAAGHYSVSFKLSQHNDRVVVLDVAPQETVASVKARLGDIVGTPGAFLKLICKGRKLSDAGNLGALAAHETLIHCTGPIEVRVCA